MSEIEDVIDMVSELEMQLRLRGAGGTGLRELSLSLSNELSADVLHDIAEIARLRNRVVHRAHRPDVVEMEHFYDQTFRVRAFLDELQSGVRAPGVTAVRARVKPLPTVVVKKFEPPEIGTGRNKKKNQPQGGWLRALLKKFRR